MGQRKRHFKTSPNPHRQVGSDPVGRTFVIFSEGTTTEPNYFREFRVLFKISVEPELHPIGGEPRTLLSRAKERQVELQEEARKQGEEFHKLFEVWIVFDDDNRPDISSVSTEARQAGISVAFSNPCFEVWGLNHFSVWDSPLNSSQAQKKLKGLMPGYDHSTNPRFDRTLIGKLYNDAVKNARQGLRRRRQERTPNGNPSTDVFKLLQAMIEKAKIGPN